MSVGKFSARENKIVFRKFNKKKFCHEISVIQNGCRSRNKFYVFAEMSQKMIKINAIGNFE